MMYHRTLWCRMWKMELNWLGLGFNFRNMLRMVVFCTGGSMHEHEREDECVGDQGGQVEYWTWDYWCSILCIVAMARIIVCPWTLVSLEGASEFRFEQWRSAREVHCQFGVRAIHFVDKDRLQKMVRWVRGMEEDVRSCLQISRSDILSLAMSGC